MRGEEDAALLARRLDELAARAERIGQPCFTGFLTPPEADMALASARRQRIEARLEGGYEDAERRMACFLQPDGREEPFPIAALELSWPHQSAPGHRDVLGSVLGLGIRRSCVGDIVVLADRAYLFLESQLADHVALSLTSAGRVQIRTRVLEAWPEVEPPQGVEVRDTVSSLRLDAVVSGGFGLSRAAAADLIAAGHVKLRHVPTQRPDVRVGEGDAISVRGYGRLVIDQVGAPTKKGRLPVRLIRYGASRKH